MKATLWLVWAAIGLLTGACKSMEPDYPLALVEYDEGLVGAWVGRSQGPAKEGAPEAGHEQRLIVSSRVVPTRSGRLNPAEPMGVRLGESVGGVTQYSFVFEGLIEDDPAAEVRLNAYLVRCGDRRLLGFQVPAQVLTDAKLVPGLVLPVHWFLWVDREGDELTLTVPKPPVMWLPWVAWAHAPGDSAPIDPERIEGQVLAVSTSIDAVITYYTELPRRKPQPEDQLRFVRLRE